MGTSDNDELSTDEMSLDGEEVENNGEKADLFSTDDESINLTEKKGIKNTTKNAVNNANKRSSRNKSESENRSESDSDSSDGEDVSQGYLINTIHQLYNTTFLRIMNGIYSSQSRL